MWNNEWKTMGKVYKFSDNVSERMQEDKKKNKQWDNEDRKQLFNEVNKTVSPINSNSVKIR